MQAFITIAFALLSTIVVSATPLDSNVAPRAALAHQAVVNMYSGTTCDGAVQSFSVVGNGAYQCVAVNGPKGSILVSEK